MVTKVFEVRDEITHIGVMATKMVGETPDEDYEVERCGFGRGSNLVIVTKMYEPESQHDAYNWPSRTMKHAHLYIEQHFDELKSGDVIDVQYILGESDAPCKSDRYWRP